MKEKSKFITFLLSFVPGLAHLYLGFKDRAIIFLMVFLGITFSLGGLAAFTNSDGFLVILVFALPIMWLIALIDAFSLRKEFISEGYDNPYGEMKNRDLEEIRKSNKKTITLALSIVPGAGHMYLGYQEKGLILMGLFFFSIFFMGWLSLSLFLFFIPLIWSYSFFDAMHIIDGNSTNADEFNLILPKIKPEWIGWGLISIGVIVAVERLLFPLISFEMRNYIQTSVVSLIFIAGGIRLLIKNKIGEDSLLEEQEDLDEED
jgi:TM2 domain-containing membrane protein YozV